MRKLSIGMLLGALVLAGMFAVHVAPAGAATATHSGIVVSTPRTKTAYNKRAVNVYPSVRVKSGYHRKVTGKRISAYAHGHRVSSGGHVHLRPGAYRVQTKIAYRVFRYQTRHRTVRVRHEGGMPDNSSCVVTAVDDWDEDGIGDDVSAADCTNPAYPGQTVHESSPLSNDERSEWQIGDEFVSDYVEYAAYTTTKRVAYQVRVYGRTTSWTTPRRPLRIKDGGYYRYWSDNDSYTTGYKRYPKGAKIYYSYDTTYSGSCYFGLDAEYRGGGYDSLVDQTRRHGSGTFHFIESVKARFNIYSSCDWELLVRWR